MTEYIVKIIAKPSVSDEVLKLLLARAFNTSPDKFEQMLDHMPPLIVARKPSEAEAQAMASKFESLGFQMEVLGRSIPVQNPTLAQPEVVQATKAQQPLPTWGALPEKNPPAARSGRAVGVDNLGEGVMALPSKRAIRWPTLPALTLSRTLSEKSPTLPPKPPLVNETNPAQGVKPQSLPTQVVEPDRIDTLVERTPRRLSLQSRVFLAGALPMLLSIILMGITLHQAVPPMLHTLLQSTARTSAIALATAVEPFVGQKSGGLEQVFRSSQADLQGQRVTFAILTDTLGNPVGGWSEGGSDLQRLPPDLKLTLKVEAGKLNGSGSTTSHVVALPDQTLVIAAAPVTSQNTRVGTMVVGINGLGFAEGFQDVLRNVLLAGLLPVFLAMLAALMVTRAITKVVMQLTRGADRIGMGDLNTEIGVRTGDELELLSHAMDRMRLGLQKHLDRQQRR